jgi:hypothetical protein
MKRLEGVGRVDNQIKVLPPWPMDNQIRMEPIAPVTATLV